MTQNGTQPKPITGARGGNAMLIAMRTFATQGELDWAGDQVDRISSSPGSCYVAQIGAQYDPGVYEATVNMVKFNQSRGLKCWMDEIPPITKGLPIVAVADMRDFAVMKARSLGFEWICLIDGDVLCPPETLVRLMKREVPFIIPYMEAPDDGRLVAFPRYEQNTGLHPVHWVSATFMMFKVSIFNLPDITFDRVNDEHMCAQFWTYGHRPYVDTDVEAIMTRAPSRGAGRSWDDRWDRLKYLYDEADKIEPDRAPVNPDESNTVNGVYTPNGEVRIGS